MFLLVLVLYVSSFICGKCTFEFVGITNIWSVRLAVVKSYVPLVLTSREVER
jgi:hypothetical protein